MNRTFVRSASVIAGCTALLATALTSAPDASAAGTGTIYVYKDKSEKGCYRAMPRSRVANFSGLKYTSGGGSCSSSSLNDSISSIANESSCYVFFYTDKNYAGVDQEVDPHVIVPAVDNNDKYSSMGVTC